MIRRPEFLRRTGIGALAAVAAASVVVPPSGAAAQTGPRSGPAIVHEGTWYLRDSPTSGSATDVFRYGTAGDLPVMGDWDGDGDDTVGTMTYSAAIDGPMIWRVRNANTAGPANATVSYSRGRDLPVVGDWDGDGDDSIGVVRNDGWLLRNSVSSGAANLTFAYGSAAYLELPVTGDWDGNGTDTPAILRNSPPTEDQGGFEHWLLRNSNSGGSATGQIAYGSDAFAVGLPFDVVPRLSWTPAPPDAVAVIDARPGGGSGEVELLWDAVAGATGYRVLRSSTPGGATTEVARLDVVNGTATVAAGVTNLWSAQHNYLSGGRLTRPDPSPSFNYVDVGGQGQRCYRVIATNAVAPAPPSPVACSPPPGG